MSPRLVDRRTFLVGAMVAGTTACLRRRPMGHQIQGLLLGRHEGAVLSVAFVDERHVWTADAGPQPSICLWDLVSRRRVRTIPAPGPIVKMDGDQGWLWSGAFTADGALLLTASNAGFGLRDGHSGESLATLRGHRRTAAAVATAPHGRLAVSGDWSGNVMLWQLPASA